MASFSYPRAVATAALQAGLTGAWIAARDLSPARRRLTRFGTVAAVAAIGWAVVPDRPEPEPELVVADKPFAVTDPPASEELPALDKRKAIIGATVVGLSVAALVGRRQLEKRWLARLTRNGHRSPTRALAVRMAAVEFATTLALQAADLRKLTR
jgi:hypothetical protein